MTEIEAIQAVTREQVENNLPANLVRIKIYGIPAWVAPESLNMMRALFNHPPYYTPTTAGEVGE